MNNRERFLAAIKGEIPDRVPVIGNLTSQLAERLAERLNLPVEMQDSFLATRISHKQILLQLGNDAVLVAACRNKNKPTIDVGDDVVEDEFGLRYKQVGLYSEAVYRPLANCSMVEDVRAYNFPKVDDEGRFDLAIETIAMHKDTHGIVGDLEASIFELAWNLVGLEKFLMDLYSEEDYIFELLDVIQDYSTKCGLKLIEMGCDMIWTGDDFGTQIGMFISPEIWKDVFKPRMKQMFAEFKSKNPNIVIAYHSCGAIAPIIPDLIEIGLDVLNPLQPLAVGMEMGELYKKYSNDLVFFGGVDVQGVLPHGSVEDVENEVLRCFKATDGGRKYIIAPAHNMQPDTPVENVFAFYEAVFKHGVIS